MTAILLHPRQALPLRRRPARLGNRAVRAFCALVSRFGEDIPVEEIERARALYDAADEESQEAFLLRVTACLIRRLEQERSRPITRAAELISDQLERTRGIVAMSWPEEKAPRSVGAVVYAAHTSQPKNRR